MLNLVLGCIAILLIIKIILIVICFIASIIG